MLYSLLALKLSAVDAAPGIDHAVLVVVAGGVVLASNVFP